MALDTLILFALTEFVLCLTPGPAVFVVVSLAMRRGVLAGWAAGAGVTAGTAFYFALSALGVGALIVASHTLFMVLKWVGGAYLVWLGVRLALPLALRLAGRGEPAPATEPAAPAGEAVAAPGLWPAFFKGFGVQLANPKTLMFFTALFPQFIAPEGNVALQFSLMAVVSAAMEMPILMAYALMSAASAKWVRGRLMVWFEGISGAVLVAIGAALAVSRGR
ncbi:MAG: LysE family translocator [Acuticoccus sp.]